MQRVSIYFGQLRRILQRRGCTRDEAEDLIQEAFLRMQEYCRKGGQVHRPEGFLARTALRLAINQRRDEHRDLYIDLKTDELTLVLDTQPLPEEILAADQCLERMRAALDAVNPRTREVLFLHRLDGLTYAQIADRNGLSISAVEKHIANALAALANVNETE